MACWACADAPPVDLSGPVAGWPEYGATQGGGHDSALTQITRNNLDRLQVAWSYHTGDVATGPGAKSSFQATPILVEDTLYFCSPFNRVIALDAETGEERWTFDPGVEPDDLYLLTCRGVSAWKDAKRPEGGPCAERIFSGTLDARLIALDRASGKPCRDFGEGGQVDLTVGIGNTEPGEYGVSSPPAVIGDLVIIGTLVLDNLRADAPGGVVRAYDARDGQLHWAWDPIVEAVADSPADPPERYRRGTANAWSILSVDPERNLVFVPTGNAPPDYYGGERDGLDYFSSSVIALNASTGELVWRFQTVHHDLWDFDVPAQPTLFDFRADGAAIPALVQATKMGHLFFLNRATGEPIFPVEERPVPRGGVTGETLAPTQPFPARPPPLHPASLDPNDAFGFTPWDRGKCRDRIAALRHEGIFTPPSLQGSVLYPGPGGGSNWGSVAIDRERRLLIANTSRLPFSVRLIPRAEIDDAGGWDPAGLSPMHGTPYAVETKPLLSPLGVPCSPPPWGVLAAIDIESGEIRWEVPLGTTRDLAPFPFWFAAGVPNQGGPIVTASGLTFIAASTDNFLRAFDTLTGEELWKGRLPAGGQATPMTYRTRADARQFVVIAAGGHGTLGTTQGDSLVAFALE
ncbi:MAG: pyrroloquinoline quinone-dependent dehydrogenase [Deltaproteobacteria bacterium]|nr:pyrroloquinoline quinone-dependent dehydrogenase [Deltaproteobacteria bacterium]MBW2363030.1 pyrroloquinoline quinone-dependent dehydrogenase [Deltaproteobacteria bacterium]